jgi:hypothetical protein
MFVAFLRMVAMMNKILVCILALVPFIACLSAAKDNTIPGTIPCSRVFVTGDQLYSVQWANKNLFKNTCMAPQANVDSATFILELKSDPTLVSNGLTSGTIEPDKEYSIRCYSVGASTTCKDSNGAAYTVTCRTGALGVECDTYNGVSTEEALIKLPIQTLLRNSARAYLYDAKTNTLVWKYDGNRPWDREFAYASQCEKKKRAGVWGVAEAQKYKCIEDKLPVQLLDAAAPEQKSVVPEESAAESAKKAQQYADCLKLAAENSTITCQQ